MLFDKTRKVEFRGKAEVGGYLLDAFPSMMCVVPILDELFLYASPASTFWMPNIHKDSKDYLFMNKYYARKNILIGVICS